MNNLAISDPPSKPAVDTQNPWPGLDAYTENVQEFFHGRVQEADKLFRHIRRAVLTVFFGQSGLGKTSLLQAAALPRLRREGFLPVLLRLDYKDAAPLSEQILKSLGLALDTAKLAEVPRPARSETLWEYFHRRHDGAGKPVVPVLVFDQFEELFTLGHASEASRDRCAALLEELADLVENRAPSVLEHRFDESPNLVDCFIFDQQEYRVLLSLREDYLPPLEDIQARMPALGQNRMRLTRMNGQQAFEAVSKPGGVLVSPDVCREIVRFVAASRLGRATAVVGQTAEDGLTSWEVEPSLLSLFCSELNVERQKQELEQITPELLKTSSNRILQDYYNRCVGDQMEAVRQFIEDELLTESGLRENMALEKARKALAQKGAPPASLERLVERQAPPRGRAPGNSPHRADARPTHGCRQEKSRRAPAQRSSRVPVLRQPGPALGHSRRHRCLDRRAGAAAPDHTPLPVQSRPGGERRGHQQPGVPDRPARRSAAPRITPGELRHPGMRDCQWEFIFDAQKTLIYERARDEADRPISGYLFVATQDYPFRVIAHFIDRNGFPQVRPGSSVEYVEYIRSQEGFDCELHYCSKGGTPHPYNGCYGERRKVDDRGLPLETVYLDRAGKPGLFKDGFAICLREYDQQGNVTRESYRGADGRPTLHKNGFASYTARFDEYDNPIENAYFSPDGKPALHKDGYARVTALYDEQGNCIEWAYFDPHGQPTLHKDGYVRSTAAYDAQGNQVKSEYFGPDGKPTLTRDGYSKIAWAFDERGNCTEWAYFGLDGQPTLHKDGYARSTAAYDAQGNQVKSEYFGPDGKPTLTRDGYSKIAWAFDERGNCTEWAYFGLDGQPTLHKDGYARCTAAYDAQGNKVKSEYFGPDGKPTLTRDGYSKIAWAYDERGNCTEWAYFGLDGQPTLHKNGYVRSTAAYDAQGYQVETEYFGPDGKPTLSRDGYAKITMARDERGNCTEWAYFGLDGQPTLHKNGYVRSTAAYDAQGYQVETEYFGPDGKPTLSRDGYAKITMARDERGNCTEWAYFGLDGQPTLHKDGYVRCTAAYDAQGYQVETEYFGPDGKPTLSRDGYAKIAWAYDERGNCTEWAYFGLDGQPTLHKDGYVRCTAAYDAQGNQVETEYFGLDGQPILHKGGYARLRWTYDNTGNKIGQTYVGLHGEPILHEEYRIARFRAVYDNRGNRINWPVSVSMTSQCWILRDTPRQPWPTTTAVTRSRRFTSTATASRQPTSKVMPVGLPATTTAAIKSSRPISTRPACPPGTRMATPNGLPSTTKGATRRNWPTSTRLAGPRGTRTATPGSSSAGTSGETWWNWPTSTSRPAHP